MSDPKADAEATYSDRIDDIASIGAFLVWAEKAKAMYGARTATECVEAFARLLNIPADKVRRLGE